jgi:hypothetical protein
MLPRDWTPVQRFKARDRWGRTGLALPVRPSPFPAGSFGSSQSCVVTGFDAGDSSLRVALLLEATPCDRTHLRRRVHLSWGSVPLQRSTTGGARISRWLTSPPAPSVHRVSHPLNGLLRPRPCQALATGFRPPFVPTALLGFPRLPSARVSSCDEGRADRHRVPSSRLSPAPRRARFRALSSRALRRCRRRILSGCGGACQRRALQSLDRRTVGSSTIANRGRRPS